MIPLPRVCVTGPESTGKTTLARRLAEHLDAELVLEASRLYAERKGAELLASDVGPIAREHLALVAQATTRAQTRGASRLVLDTDLMSTVVYARHYYGVIQPWIEAGTREHRADLYLLCDVDVPWVADPVRDRPTNRASMFTLFHEELAALGARTVIVRGDWETRWTIAAKAVGLLAGRPGLADWKTVGD